MTGNDSNENDKALRHQLRNLAGPDDYEKAIAAIESIASLALHKGLLPLEQYMVDISDPFLRTLLQCVIDGMDPAEIKVIADNHARATLRQRATYLNIVRQGVESIQDGHRPPVISARLHAILGTSKPDTSSAASEGTDPFLSEEEIKGLLNL